MAVKGIDVSDHQGDVDWRKVKHAGYDFAFVKVTEGVDFTSRTFTKARIKAMRAAHVTVGCYHYLRPQAGRKGAAEADHFVRVAKAAGWDPDRDLPLVMDIEETRLVPAGTLEYASSFAQRVRKLTGRGVITYTFPGFVPRMGNRAPEGGDLLWIAAWDAVDGHPPVPRGFKCEYTLFHQISDRGHVPGVSGGVDVNLFLGGSAQLERLVKGSGYLRKCGGAADDDLNVRETQTLLRKIGWPITVDGHLGTQTRTAIRDFQRGYARDALVVDGKVGPRTERALRWSAEHDGRASEHFRFSEFRSKPEHCNGNRWIKVDRALIIGLERYRAKVGPTTIVSGYRDPAKNKCEGGVTSSMHMYGNGADLVPKLTVAQVKALGAFSGIGYQRATGLVRHVDVRHRGPNFTGGTISNPTVWIYG